MSDDRYACVCDHRVVLTTGGYHALAGLRGNFEVWLPRELVTIFRNITSYEADPSRLIPQMALPLAHTKIDFAAEGDEMRNALRTWSRLLAAPEFARLDIRFFGDNQGIESATGPHIHPQIMSRFEALASVIDRSIERSSFDLRRAQPLLACYRDAIALAGAFSPSRAFVLTRLESDGVGEPTLAEYARRWGLKVSFVPHGGGRQGRALRAALDRSNLGFLTWSGVKLAAVHVLLPGLVWGSTTPSDSTVAEAWKLAELYWHTC